MRKKYCALVMVEMYGPDKAGALEKLERMNNEVYRTYHGHSNILTLIEEAE